MRKQTLFTLATAIVKLLLAATYAYGAPTATVRENAVLLCAPCAVDCAVTPAIHIGEISPDPQAYNTWNLASIAAELLKPPADFSVASTSPGQVTALPAVPSAVFMALTGFICVSLVKDRKLWIAALAGLLWAGQAGFTVLPQLARHVATRKQTQPLALASLNYRPELFYCERARGDIEGTRYIGLLRYLDGIPNTANSVQRTEPERTAYSAQRAAYSVQGTIFLNNKCYTLNASRHTTYNIRHTTKSPQFAWASVCDFSVPATKRLAYINKQHFYFSPAFTFENLARGPPK
jgi:hypothetical protein